MKTPLPNQPDEHASLLNRTVGAQMPAYRKATGLSLVISLLTLSPVVFMLEVYDRVLNSLSTTTLLSLLVCVVGLYVMIEMVGIVRGRMLRQAGWQVDVTLREKLHDATFAASLLHGSATVQPFNDLRTVREFIASPALTAIMDLPSSLIFLILVSMINPWLGGLALVGAVVQVVIGINTEKKIMPALTEANRAAILAQDYVNGVMRNAQVISAMGMKTRIAARWMARQREFLTLQALASDTAGSNAASSKFIQTIQGSLILGVACWLAMQGTLAGGGGMMIVASTLGGRVLAPLVQLITQWRQVVNARDAYQRLDNFLGTSRAERDVMPLPAPQGKLSVEAIVAAAPGSNLPIIKGVSFALQPGETLMVIGPSAAGKTTLARLLMGIWAPASGKVRLDGADIHAWNKSELGPSLGYLPQTVELFDGTLAENIARFGDVDMNKVGEATDLVGLTALAEALPYGFDTLLGDDGAMLSGGQRQRVGLARAIYGDPRFILLDEPNSSLDEAGEQALMKTLLSLKARRCTTVVITHRSGVLAAADKILLLRDGQVGAFGPRDEVLAALRQASAPKMPGVAVAAGGAA